MKRTLTLIAGTALLALGVWSAVALGASHGQRRTPGVLSTTTGETTDSTPTEANVWVCHHTGSWKHPYQLIHISPHALNVHLGNGGVLPGANNSCPTIQPAGARAHGHGKGHEASRNGHGHGRNDAAEAND